MNDVESRLRWAFRQQAEREQPHGQARAELDRRIRRSRVRRRTTAAATAVVVGIAAYGSTGFRGLAGSGPSGPVPLADGLRSIDALRDTVTIKGVVPGGGVFHAEALGADGTVLGRTPDSTAWRAGPHGGAPVSLGVRARGGLSAGPGFITWIPQGTWELQCAATGHSKRTITSPSGHTSGPVWGNGDSIIWLNVMAQPFIAQGCTIGTGVNTEGSVGDTVAAAPPMILQLATVRTATSIRTTGLLAIDSRTGSIVSRSSLPPGIHVPLQACHPLHPDLPGIAQPPSRPSTSPARRSALPVVMTCDSEPRLWTIATGSGIFAWTFGGVLRLAKKQTWTDTRTLPAKLPKPTAEGQTQITIGRRLVAFSTTGTTTQSVVYDLRTHRTMTLRGQALVTGDWLLWQNGTDYRLTHVPG